MKKYKAAKLETTALADKPEQLIMPKMSKKPGMAVRSGLKAAWNPGGR